MKLIVTQENLNKALVIVSKIAGNKTPLPILGNILIKTEKNRLLLAATNLEIAITIFIGTKVEKSGSITIPARLISDFVANLPKNNIEIESNGLQIHIKSGLYQSTINGMKADEFPDLPEIDDKKSISLELETKNFKNAISQTIGAASHDNTRPMLTGAFLHTNEGKLFIAATDGYRLAEKQIEGREIKKQIEAIIPVSTLQEVVRIIPEEQKKINVLIDENQVRFRAEDIEITSKLIDANYVDYRQLIPKKQDNKVVIEKEEFQRITKIASLFAQESAGGVTIKIEPKDNQISMHSIASQLGENTSSAKAKVVGEGSITLNSKYLLEALSSIEGEIVEFSFNDKLSPSLIIEKDTKTPLYKHIIMPLKS